LCGNRSAFDCVYRGRCAGVCPSRQSSLWMAFYVAWAEDVLFFSLLGVFIWLWSIRLPDREGFDRRLDFLFGEAPSVVRNYNRWQVKRLSAYSPQATRTIIITGYCEDLSAHKVSVETKYKVKNLLWDEAYEDKMEVSINPDTLQTDKMIGEIESVKINDVEQLKRRRAIYSGEYARMPLEFNIDAGQSVSFCSQYWVMMKINEKQILRPLRVVELYEMRIVNRCPDELQPVIQRQGESSITFGGYNQSHSFEPVQGVSPHESIFEFLLRAPAQMR
jgi:hypothetical protein